MFSKIYVCLISCVFMLWNASVTAEVNPEKLEKGKWLKVSTPNFTIYSDDKKKGVVGLAEDLERFRIVAQSLMGVKLIDSDRPVKIVATKKRYTFKTLLGGVKSYKSFKGLFKGDESGNYAVVKMGGRSGDKDIFKQTTRHVLFHEYVHYLASFAGGKRLPLWFSEGMADFLGSVTFKGKDVVHVGRVIGYHILNLRHMRWIPIEEILKKKTINFELKRRAYRIYSEGWLLVHYCMMDAGRRKKLFNYITEIQSGKSVDQAFKSAFKMSYRDLDNKLRGHYTKESFPVMPFRIENTAALNNIVITEIGKSETDFEIGEMLLNAFGNYDDARILFERAIELDPNNAHAIAGLANVHFFNDVKKAQKTIDRAIALAPEDAWVNTVRGHIYKRLAFNSLESNKHQYTELLRTAKRAYSKAINNGGINVEAMIEAADLFRRTGKVDKALDVLEIARSYSPTGYLVRQNLFSIYYAAGRVEDAEKILSGLKSGPHKTENKIQKFDEWANKVRVQNGYPEKKIEGADSSA